MTDQDDKTCIHCGARLQPMRMPDGTGWEEPFHLVCFNDECSYFVRGWERMEQEYAQHKSYRYRVNPSTGKASPLPVWSMNSMKNFIIEEGDE